jgi:serine/threonine protein kinase
MPIAIGTKLGRYDIRAVIGVGGMGEVYRASDPKIGRDVAIKVLPADFSADRERVARFEQEVQAAGALSHPNILPIYDVDSQDGVLYVVSELLEGEELRQRLDEGPIPLRKVTEYAQQIVSGLSAAHEKGIVHRDLKPENLFITKDDRVKILDFGLAKLSEPGAVATGSEDATRRALTNPGVVMGTVGYMSPEQVRGHATDHRSDIFSFGVILYEMITGKRAFQHETMADTMSAILRVEPAEIAESNPNISPSLERIVRRCLEKKPERRFQSTADLGFALESLSTPTNSSGNDLTTTANAWIGETPKQSGWFSRLSWAAAGLFLASTVVLAGLYFRRSEPRSQTMRFSLMPPEKTTFTEASAISPDGQQLTFITLGTAGVTSLWVRPLASVESRQLPGTEGALFPFWSPDSRFIGFFAGGKLRKIEAAGGPATTLADASADPRGGTWADGTIIFGPGTLSPLMRVAASGGSTSAVTTLDTELGQTSHRWPSFLPDGKHFIYFGRGSKRDKQGLFVSSIDSPGAKFLVAASVTGTYTEAGGKGYLLFIREFTLMAQQFDAGKVELSGEAVPLVQGVLSFPSELGPTAYAAFSASAGHLVYRTGDQQTTRLAWFDRSGKSLGAVTESGSYHEPSLSMDGKKIIFGRSEGMGTQDIFLLDLSRGNTTRLIFDPAMDSGSVFSPDESQVVFSSNRSGKNDFYRKASSGAGSDELVLNGIGNPYPDSWSRDGKYLLYEMDGGSKTKVDLWVLPMLGDPKPFPYLQSEFTEIHAQFSPDGRWVAYTSDEYGRAEVFVQSFPVSGGKWQISTAGGDQPQWRSDGKELFYMAADRSLMAVPISGGSTLEVGKPIVLFQMSVPLTGISDDRNNYVPTQDGQKFLLNSLTDATNLQPLTLVLNWAADLKK